jgi:hypothetical protein
MKLLQDLLKVKAAQAAIPVSEDRERFEDVEDALRWWEDGNQYHHWEGERGVNQLEELLNDWLDYDDLEHFLSDNPGCIESILEFIKKYFGDKLTKEMQKVADREFMDSLHDTSAAEHKDIPSDANVLVRNANFTAWIEDNNKNEVYISAAGVDTLLYKIKERKFVDENGDEASDEELAKIRSNPGYKLLLIKLRSMHEGVVNESVASVGKEYEVMRKPLTGFDAGDSVGAHPRTFRSMFGNLVVTKVTDELVYFKLKDEDKEYKTTKVEFELHTMPV